jgi:hypothetical protein
MSDRDQSGAPPPVPGPERPRPDQLGKEGKGSPSPPSPPRPAPDETRRVQEGDRGDG